MKDELYIEEKKKLRFFELIAVDFLSKEFFHVGTVISVAFGAFGLLLYSAAVIKSGFSLLYLMCAPLVGLSVFIICFFVCSVVYLTIIIVRNLWERIIFNMPQWIGNLDAYKLRVKYIQHLRRKYQL